MIRSVLAVAGAVAGAVTTLALTAPHASADPVYRAHWMLDELGTPATAVDTTDNHNDGANVDIVGDGNGYLFNGSSSRVTVPSSPSLNPGAADFSWGATISMTAPPSPNGETYDVLRKGLVSTKGGDYKIEVKSTAKGVAVARCVAKTWRSDGTKQLAAIQGNGKTLADSAVHVITCTKTADTITLLVDSRTPRAKTSDAGLGSVSNTSELALGAKAENNPASGFDWFQGEIYDAWVA